MVATVIHGLNVEMNRIFFGLTSNCRVQFIAFPMDPLVVKDIGQIGAVDTIQLN